MCFDKYIEALKVVHIDKIRKLILRKELAQSKHVDFTNLIYFRGS